MNIITKIKSKLIKNEFYSNVATLMSGSIISQTIPIIISPILSRIYSPEDFSILAIYLSITNIFSVIASGRYDLAIMLPDKNEDAINILSLSIMISFFTTSILIPFSLIFKNQISFLLKNDKLSNWLLFSVFGILLTTIHQNLIYWNNRNKKFKTVSINRVVQSGASGFFQIIFGYFLKKLSSGFIIVGQFLGQVFAAARLIFSFIKSDRGIIKEISLKKIKEVAKRYSEFPKKTTLSSLLNIFSNNGRYLVLGFFLDKNSLGSLFFTLRILMLPVSIIGNNIADVVFQRVSELKNKGVNKNKIKREINKIILQLSSFLIIPVIILAIFGKQIFSFIFGPNYAAAGIFSSILSFSLFFQFIFSPFCKVFFAFEKNTLYLIWEILRIIIFYIPIFILGYLKVQSIYFIVSIALSIILNYSILYVFLQRILYEKNA
ncbi:MAG: oligosaccharide flippase family protein [Exilispira sp.]|jgi:O-antigen/teichoic acid export membrane protein|nr:oligosaccharide flippase family protein [Exilispira sp.]